MVPQTWIKLQVKKRNRCLDWWKLLEDHDDVQHVWANFDIEEDELVKLAG